MMFQNKLQAPNSDQEHGRYKGSTAILIMNFHYHHWETHSFFIALAQINITGFSVMNSQKQKWHIFPKVRVQK